MPPVEFEQVFVPEPIPLQAGCGFEQPNCPEQVELQNPENVQSGWQFIGHAPQSCRQLPQVSPREAAQFPSPHQPTISEVFW